MIHTLCSSLALYKVHRDKPAMLTRQERKRAALILLAVIVFVMLAVIIIISQRPCPFCQ